MHADLCAARWYCGHLGQKVGKKWEKSGKKVGKKWGVLVLCGGAKIGAQG